jgi:hypothetical protein
MKGQTLVFQYDNSNDIQSRNFASHPHHKHQADGSIVESREMSPGDVLSEIENIIEIL